MKKSMMNSMDDARLPSPTLDEFHLPVRRSITPFGAIIDAYDNTLKYIADKKRLEVELERIKEASRVERKRIKEAGRSVRKAIDREYRLKLKKLQAGCAAFAAVCQRVDAQQAQAGIERTQVLEMARLAQERSFDMSLSREERRMHAEMSERLVKQLQAYGEGDRISIGKLIAALALVGEMAEGRPAIPTDRRLGGER